MQNTRPAASSAFNLFSGLIPRGGGGEDDDEFERQGDDDECPRISLGDASTNNIS